MNYEYLTQEEIQKILAYVPTRAYLQLITEPVVLAGGLIRDVIAGVEPKDVDIFCHSEEQAERLAFAAGLGRVVKRTTFAYSVPLSLPVQFIFYKDYADAKDLIRQFDFRACCAGITFLEQQGVAGWEGIAVEGFREDCAAKALRFMSQDKDRDKLTALRRALNFAAKGWTIHNEEVSKIVTHFEPTLEPERVRRSLKPAYGR